MSSMFYSQGKLREYAEAFRRLTKVYVENKRDALALQLEETAAMLERVAGDDRAGCLSPDDKKKIYDYFKGCGIVSGGMLIMETQPGHIEMIFNLHMEKRGCIMAKQIAEDLGRVLGRGFKTAAASRQVVTKEPGEFIFEEMPKYRLLFGHASCNKGFSRISGDNHSFISLEGGKSIVSLADGMGCGIEAGGFSTRFIELLEQLLETGFSEGSALRLLNNVFAVNDTVGIPVTLDVCSINEYEGKARFWKMGAAASFIKGREGVRTIDSSSLPAGVLEEPLIDNQEFGLSDGDYIIMMSDGVLDALPFYDKEKRMEELIGRIDASMPQAIAQNILDEVFFYNNGVTDDMTVLVTGVWRLRAGEHNVR